MIAALDNFSIKKIMKIINEIYESDHIPEISRSIFIAQPKKPGFDECELHQRFRL